MSDTPRTDDVELHYRQMEDRDAPLYIVNSEFARTLERENTSLREQLRVAQEELREFAYNARRFLYYCQAHNWGNMPEPYDSLNPLVSSMNKALPPAES